MSGETITPREPVSVDVGGTIGPAALIAHPEMEHLAATAGGQGAGPDGGYSKGSAAGTCGRFCPAWRPPPSCS
ncbi:hypothetical protein [Actinomadura sp. 3N407]|uniref:hypothetical protein n=1 Tax=Actinomadura sp. 3N407 TaxID=3457423 RepID=UPI003FCE6A6C